MKESCTHTLLQSLDNAILKIILLIVSHLTRVSVSVGMTRLVFEVTGGRREEPLARRPLLALQVGPPSFQVLEAQIIITLTLTLTLFERNPFPSGRWE